MILAIHAPYGRYELMRRLLTLTSSDNAVSEYIHHNPPNQSEEENKADARITKCGGKLMQKNIRLLFFAAPVRFTLVPVGEGATPPPENAPAGKVGIERPHIAGDRRDVARWTPPTNRALH